MNNNHIFYDAVLPRMALALMVEGPGKCGSKLRIVGCSFFQVSHQFSIELRKHLPNCAEPHCPEKAFHKCAGGAAICCKHAYRFGYFHRRHKDWGCVCAAQPTEDDDGRTIEGDADWEYCMGIYASWYRDMFFITLVQSGEDGCNTPWRRVNITLGTLKGFSYEKEEEFRCDLLDKSPYEYQVLTKRYGNELDAGLRDQKKKRKIA